MDLASSCKSLSKTLLGKIKAESQTLAQTKKSKTHNNNPESCCWDFKFKINKLILAQR